jgi:NAD(P)-dependent dehydrogenase (short-subunit alcohol dehydrogenase family)
MINKKKILVTGASSGIGLALCEYLLDNYCKVVAVGRDVSKVSHLIDSDLFVFATLDLNNFEEYGELFNSNLNQEKFDGFVHCAGMEETLPMSLYTPEKIQNIYNINVFSGIELLRFFSKKKYSNESASVVFISSVMGELGQPGKIGYCSSKAAILGVVKSAALELAKRKIRVNAISPGVVNTPMTKKLFKLIDEGNINRIKEMHPLGIGEVGDIVPTLAFLLSNNSKWITGQNIKIDGGYSIQ